VKSENGDQKRQPETQEPTTKCRKLSPGPFSVFRFNLSVFQKVIFFAAVRAAALPGNEWLCYSNSFVNRAFFHLLQEQFITNGYQ
jgi:hypothetical protein